MKTVNLIALLATAGLVADFVVLPANAIPLPGPAGFYLPLWVLLLYPGWAAVAVTTTIFRPAFNASIPRLVGPKELPVANGAIYAVAATVSAVASLVVGGVLTFVDPAYALGVAFLLFFAAQVALLLVRSDLAPTQRGPKRSVVKEASAGYSVPGEATGSPRDHGRGARDELPHRGRVGRARALRRELAQPE